MTPAAVQSAKYRVSATPVWDLPGLARNNTDMEQTSLMPILEMPSPALRIGWLPLYQHDKLVDVKQGFVWK